MVNLKPANHKPQLLKDIKSRSLLKSQFLLLALASVLIHSLGLILLAFYHPHQPTAKEATAKKPIDFIVVPEDSEAKPPPEKKEEISDQSVASNNQEPITPQQEPIPSQPRAETAPQPEAKPATARTITTSTIKSQDTRHICCQA